MTDEVLTAWKDFLADVARSSEKLQRELADFCRALAKLTDELESRTEAVEASNSEVGALDSLERLFGADAGSLLLDTLESYDRQRLHDRLPRILDEFKTDLEDAAGKLPGKARFSARDLLEGQPAPVTMAWRARIPFAGRQPRSLPLRAAAGHLLESEEAIPRRLLGRIHLFHSQAVIGLLDPWQSHRLDVLERVRGGQPGQEAARRTAALWKSQSEKRAQAATHLLEAVQKSLEGLPGRISARLSAYSSKRFRRRPKRTRNEAFWRRQRTCVRAAVEAETSIVRLGAKAVELARNTAVSAEDEHRAVLDEIEAVLEAFRGWSAGSPNPTPAPTARLRAAEDRAERWRDRLARLARQILPEEVDTIKPAHPLPGWRSPWRTVPLRKMFEDSLAAACELAAEGLAPAERTHLAAVREIERAREVVAYGIETAEKEAENRAIAEESIQNATALLEHQLDLTRSLDFSASSLLAEATGSTFYQLDLAFEHGRMSLASHLAREGGYKTLRRGRDVAIRWARSAVSFMWVQLRRATQWFLVYIGWEAPLESGLEPVERWRYLSEEFALDVRPRQLPLIYTRLFRVEPVEDPRFLIGRDPELEALAEAKDRWEKQKPTTVIVTGERGSGKTSILNCAAVLLFADAGVVRAPMRERILTAEGMRAFLSAHLGFEKGDLIENLNASRRVILLEEVERAFLRVIGGTEALRELLRIVVATSASNLWLLSMTGAGFRFLDAYEEIAGSFSHRINASSVEPDQLQSAVLQRHNLSGLRLDFRKVRKGWRFEQWISRQTGMDQDPQSAFFNTLFVQTGGVYRSAFAYWQNHIDRAEGGILYMQSPRELDYSRVTEELARKDLFTLHLIRQHGSLTAEEHARIFDQSPDLSQARLGHLLDREIIQPEPDAPGYRIRPEAGALVRAALSAENLV